MHQRYLLYTYATTLNELKYLKNNFIVIYLSVNLEYKQLDLYFRDFTRFLNIISSLTYTVTKCNHVDPIHSYK